jgi:hypothetical protein
VACSKLLVLTRVRAHLSTVACSKVLVLIKYRCAHSWVWLCSMPFLPAPTCIDLHTHARTHPHYNFKATHMRSPQAALRAAHQPLAGLGPATWVGPMQHLCVCVCECVCV